MVNEKGFLPTIAELGTGERAPFEQSADQLLRLAAAIEEDADPQYCVVTWDQEQPARVAAITLATISPTGAGRHLEWGRLHQSQFAVTERTADGTTIGQRFIWCSTYPRAIGDPVELDDRQLTTEHGYARLGRDYLYSEIMGRANSLGDYMALRKLMGQYHLDSTAIFGDSLRSYLASLVHRGNISFTATDLGKVLGVAEAYGGHTEALSPKTQGRIVSILLAGISGRIQQEESPEFVDPPEAAAATLVSALETGSLPNEHRIMDRVLGSPVVYAFPFATHLLHDHLIQSNHNHTRRIFQNERLDLVRMYIATVAGAATANADVQSYLTAIESSRIPSGNPDEQRQRLYRLVNALGELTAEEQEHDLLPPVTNLIAVAPAFDDILRRLEGTEKFNITDATLRQECVEAVELLLTPPIRRLGGKALREVLESLPENLDSEENDEPFED